MRGGIAEATIKQLGRAGPKGCPEADQNAMARVEARASSEASPQQPKPPHPKPSMLKTPPPCRLPF